MVFLNLVPRGLMSLYFQDLPIFCAVSSQTIGRWNAIACAHPLKSPLHPPCMEISTLVVNFMGIYVDKFSFTWHLKSFNSFYFPLWSGQGPFKVRWSHQNRNVRPVCNTTTRSIIDCWGSVTFEYLMLLNVTWNIWDILLLWILFLLGFIFHSFVFLLVYYDYD